MTIYFPPKLAQMMMMEDDESQPKQDDDDGDDDGGGQGGKNDVPRASRPPLRGPPGGNAETFWSEIGLLTEVSFFLSDKQLTRMGTRKETRLLRTTRSDPGGCDDVTRTSVLTRVVTANPTFDLCDLRLKSSSRGRSACSANLTITWLCTVSKPSRRMTWTCSKPSLLEPSSRLCVFI